MVALKAHDMGQNKNQAMPSNISTNISNAASIAIKLLRSSDKNALIRAE